MLLHESVTTSHVLDHARAFENRAKLRNAAQHDPAVTQGRRAICSLPRPF